MDQDITKTRASTRQAATPAPTARGAGRRLAPAAMVIFGAGGDLTKRLIVPALCHLVRAKELPDEFIVIGVDHNDRTTEQWRRMMTEALRQSGQDAVEEKVCSWLVQRMHYMRGDFTEAETFSRLGKLLTEQQTQQNRGGNVLFYLAVGDRFFGPIVDQLGQA